MHFLFLCTVKQSFVQLGPRVLCRRLCSGVTGAKHRETPWLSVLCPVQEGDCGVPTVEEVP